MIQSAREIRAKINKYTRLCERDCVCTYIYVYICVCVRGTCFTVCDPPIFARVHTFLREKVFFFRLTVRTWCVCWKEEKKKKGRRSSIESTRRGRWSRRSGLRARSIREHRQIAPTTACARVWPGSSVTPPHPFVSPLPFVFLGGNVEKDWPPNARTANLVSCTCSGANGRCSLNVC